MFLSNFGVAQRPLQRLAIVLRVVARFEIVRTSMSRMIPCAFDISINASIGQGCAAVDQMKEIPFANRRGKVATYTIDRLAFTPQPAPEPSSNIATLKPALRSGLQDQTHQVKKRA